MKWLCYPVMRGLFPMCPSRSGSESWTNRTATVYRASPGPARSCPAL